MKKLWVLIGFLMASPFALGLEQRVDFDRVNQVLGDVSQSLIEGDEVFSELTAEINTEKTNLDAQQISGRMSLEARSTGWSSQSSRLSLDGFAFKKAELVKQEEELVTTQIGVLSQLETQTISFLKFSWSRASYFCDSVEDVPTPVEYLEFKLCPFLTSRIESLVTGRDMVLLAQDGLLLVQSSLGEYVDLIQEKMSETQSEDLKEWMSSLLTWAEEIQVSVDRIEVVDQGSKVEVVFPFEEFMGRNFLATFRIQVGEEAVGAQLDILIDLQKALMDDIFSWLKSSLLKLQNEDQETLGALKDQVGSYLEMLKEWIN